MSTGNDQHTPNIRNQTFHYHNAAARRRYAEANRTIHEDPVLRTLGMIRRHASLPTIRELFHNRPDTGQFRVLADNNIGSIMTEFMQNKGALVAAVPNTKAHGARDMTLYYEAMQYGAVLFSRDKGFTEFGTKPEQYDLRHSPGVVVLPQGHLGVKALTHFFTTMPLSADHWRTKVVEYRPDRMGVIYSLPFRESVLDQHLPTVQCFAY